MGTGILGFKGLTSKTLRCEKSFKLKSQVAKGFFENIKGETLIYLQRFLKKKWGLYLCGCPTSLRAVSPGIMLLLVLV